MTAKFLRRGKETGSDTSKGRGRKPFVRERVNIGVSINSDLWRRLRALAITQGRLTGDLLDEAVKKYLEMPVK